MISLDTAETTRLGRTIRPLAEAHPSRSGVFALPDGRDAFAARVLLADAAERTLDVQYYIWRNDLSGKLLMAALRRAAAARGRCSPPESARIGRAEERIDAATSLGLACRRSERPRAGRSARVLRSEPEIPMSLLEWARRRSGGNETVPKDELAQADARELSRRSGVPLAWLEGVRSFYADLGAGDAPRVCVGTACAFERRGTVPAPPFAGVHCFGRCYEAPFDASAAAAPIPRSSLVEPPIVLRHVVAGGGDPFQDYDLPSGDAILDAVTRSGLRGRGGAAFPTGAKWRTARDTSATDRYVVANGDEGDPGAYVDRLLLEESPHAVLAGMLACARAIGARRGIVFVRGEYASAAARVEAAIEEARSRGKLDGFSVRVARGAGSYVAGEETALLRSIEGLRAEPTPKPPYPAERGLEGLPTVVQNVETLAVVPWVVRTGARAGTKAISLSGALARPGVTEIALGTPLAEVLARAGGGPVPGRRWKMALVGGPMGRVVPAREFEVRLSFEALPGMGHGGVVVLDESVSARDLAAHLFDFAASESCGSCTPCRAGTARLAGMRDLPALERLLRTLEIGSLCGFGQGVPRPIRDLARAFPGELFP